MSSGLRGRYWRVAPAATALCLALACAVIAAETAPLRDPTRPTGWQPRTGSADTGGEDPAAGLRLHGTYSVGGERSAVISGRRVAVGDRVSGAEVVEIGRNSVRLRIGDETRELAAAPAAIKSPATQGTTNR